MDYKKSIFHKFETINQLPSLPEVLLKLIQACNQDTTDIAAVSGIIETDPSLSIRILRLVNSARYGLPRRVEGIRQAVNLLGMNTVRNFAFCASIHEVFPGTRKNAAFDLRGFWWHSLLCGLLAKRLAEVCRCEKIEDAFLCGLFHDIGKLVLWKCIGDDYIQLLSEGMEQNESPLDVELRLGVTHAEAGAWLLHHWGLPTFMSDGILYHHEDRSRITSAFSLVKVVFCAHEICLEAGKAEKNDIDFQVAKEVIGISRGNARSAFERAVSEIEEVAGALEIKVKAPRKAPGESCKAGVEQMKLAGEVRDLSLLRGTLEGLMTAENQADIVRVLLEGVDILFDRAQVLIFLFDDEFNVFYCVQPLQSHMFFFNDSNAIPLEQSRSLIVRCMTENRTIDSYSEKAGFTSERPIMDEQIISFLGKDGIYCVPIRASGVGLGVLVMAMDVSEQAFFSQQENVFSLFAQQAGLALLAERSRKKHFDAIHRERMDAVYRLERKISHEVRNPLSIIKNYLQILGMKISDHNIAQQEISIIQEEIDRVSNILEQLSSLSPDSDRLAIEYIDINRMIEDMSRIMEESLKVTSGVTLRLELEKGLPAVKATRDALKQVLINLVRNAAEAMKDGGDLIIKTRRLEAYKLTGNGSLEKTKADGVEISVTDNGPGIPESLLPRLFEPFVTGKKGDHSGLGLSIVHSLVDSCGGQVTCGNNPGGGSTFKVVLSVEEDS